MSCVGYSTKVAMLRRKLPIISFLLVQTLRTLKRNYSTTQRLKRTFFRLSPKIEELLPPPQTQDPVSAYASIYPPFRPSDNPSVLTSIRLPIRFSVLPFLLLFVIHSVFFDA